MFPSARRAMDQGRTSRAWVKVQESQARLKHMKCLRDEGIGFNIDENYVRKSDKHRRTDTAQGMRIKKVIRTSMQMRVADETKNLKALKETKNEVRKTLMKQYGKNSMKYKKTLTRLNRMSKAAARKNEEKLDKKLQHLKGKHKEAKNLRELEKRTVYIPKWKDKFREADIYNEDEENFQKLLSEIDAEHEAEQTLNIGGAELNVQENKLLKLPPGMALTPKLTETDFNCNNEVMFAKLRMEIKMWKEHDEDYDGGLESETWNNLGDEAKEAKAREEAKLRQIFDPIVGVLDFSKKRVTDSNYNSYTSLPPEMAPGDEAYIHLRRNRYKGVLREHLLIMEDRKTEFLLDKDEAAGLKSLSTRIKEGDLVGIKTDKSGKMGVATPDAYLEMGRQHTDKDEKVDMKTLEEMSSLVSSHTSAWLKMFGVGESQGGHPKRFRESYMGGDTPAPRVYPCQRPQRIGHERLP